ncbi:MAG: helix-turn-helix domain-containing protein [Solirubrobacterales bacterium]
MSSPDLGGAIKRLRVERNLTQEDLAHKAGITTGTLSRTETGETSPSWRTVKSIAEALDMSAAELVATAEHDAHS